MKARLIGAPGSHPSLAAQLMLEHKGIEYRRRDLVNSTQRLVLPLLRYRGKTVPVLRLDGERLERTTTIARALDRVRPEPPLFPSDPDARRAVEEAEAWADGELQDCARRLGQWAATCDRESLWLFAAGSYLPVPRPLLKAMLSVFAPLLVARIRVPDESARRRLAALPAHLDRVDRLIADGIIGGEQPNAADFQIATCIRLLTLFDDLRPQLEQRPAGRLALRLVPHYPGHFRSVFPAEWLA